MKIVCIGHSTFDITLPVEEYPIEKIKELINENKLIDHF